MPVTSPFAWLEAVGRQSPALASELRRIAPSALRMVLYSDAVTPGDSFGHMSRKFTAVYFTFLELGPEAMSRDECWFVAAVVRESVLQNSAAGVSQLYRRVLERFFGRSHGRHDLREGVTLDFQDGGEAVLLHGTLGVVLGDELGLKEAIHCKGHAGTHPCVCCFNVLKMGDSRCSADGPLYPLTSVKTDKFELHTDESIRNILRRLGAASLDTSRGHVGRMKELTTNLGFNHEPYGWLLSDDIPTDLVSTLMWDWMHVYFVSGIFEIEVVHVLLFVFWVCVWWWWWGRGFRSGFGKKGGGLIGHRALEPVDGGREG